MKSDILKTHFESDRVQQYTSLVEVADIEATKSAHGVICVSENNMAWMRTHTDRPILLAPNGVNPWVVTDEARSFALGVSGGEKYAFFCSSAHLPNIQGFFDMLGGAFGSLDSDQKLIVAGGASEYIVNDSRMRESAKLPDRVRPAGVVDPDQLAGLIDGAHCIVLPITQGGGTNLKTAEALWSGKRIVATTGAMRGFEKFIGSPGIEIADTSREFKRALRRAMERPPLELTEEERDARRCVLWDPCLHELPEFIEKIARG